MRDPQGVYTTVKRLLRRWVPMGFRQAWAQARRQFQDRRAGLWFHDGIGGERWPVQLVLSQPVFQGQLYENKLANLRLGAGRINGSLIPPGERWSFWNRVGKPTSSHGFLEGRNIVNGELVRQAGGGLCQLSSLVYHLALLGGLEILERHAHSLDLYRDHERFTPLGADATVVWGTKDLRFRNPHPFPVSLACFLDQDGRLVGQWRSEDPMVSQEVHFLGQVMTPGRVRVRTTAGGKVLQITDYEQRPGLQAR